MYITAAQWNKITGNFQSNKEPKANLELSFRTLECMAEIRDHNMHFMDNEWKLF